MKHIATSLGHHIATVMCFLADPLSKKKPSDSGTLKAVTTRKLRHVRKNLLKKAKPTSKTNFNKTNLPEISKSPRCWLPGNLAKNAQPEKQPPLSPRYKKSRLQWAKKVQERLEDNIVHR